jgi:hypothetical protein
MTTTLQKHRGEELAAQVNLGEVLDWRLHWLTLRLEQVQKKTDALASHSRVLHGAIQDLMPLVQELEAITVEFQQLKQQTKMMLGLDYDDEVKPLFDHVPKYTAFCGQLQTTKSALEAKAKAAVESDLNFVLSRIESASKTR